MPSASLPECLDVVRDARNAAHKLVVIAGAAGTGKTRLLRELALATEAALVNLGLELSRRMMGLTKRQRTLKAEELARDLIDGTGKTDICLDNSELLFDATIELNPLTFLQDISRNRLIIATWNGICVGHELVYGEVGHPDYHRQVVQGLSVIALSDGNRRILHL